MNAWIRLAGALVAGAVGVGQLGACGSSANDSAFAPTEGARSPSPGEPGNGNSGGGAASGDGGGASLPPETKSEGAYRSPVATGHVVWIANPASGRVAYIDAASLEVRTVEAGNGPTYLAAVPDPTDDVAIVLNVLSHDATLLRDAQGNQGPLVTRTFPATADANSWAVAPSGRWAIAWTDATLVARPDPTQGFQDVAVLDLSGARPSPILAVGYRPVKVAFSGDGARAFAVTEDGISVIDLLGGAQPSATQNFVIPPATSSAGGGATPASGPPDVSFTPDGAYALVRRDGEAAITVVALSNGATTRVTLPANATDLTLSPTGDFAVAVMRDTSTLAILPIPAIATAPTAFTTMTVAGETVGRAIVTRDGKSALLFTTVAPIDHLVVVALGAAPSFRVINLHAPVHAVFPSDDGRSAIVLNDVSPTSGSSVRGAFSVVPIAGDLPAKIVGLPAPPTAVAIAPTSDRALVSMRDDATHTYGFYLAKMPSQEVTPYLLASPPIAVGIAAGAARGYVAQDYDEGRITFVDFVAGQARTITGFELGARVVDGSQP